MRYLKLFALAFLSVMLCRCETAPLDPDGGDPEEGSGVELSVSPDRLTYDPDDPGGCEFTVKSNFPWTAEADTDELTFEPMRAEAGETVVTVTGMAPGKTGNITVTTEKKYATDDQKSATVSVTGLEPEVVPPPAEVVIYHDDLDAATYSGGAVYIDQWDGYINAEGLGAGTVYYTGQTVSIRNNFTSTGYPDASGKNAFNFGNNADAHLVVHDIALKPGQECLELTFGVVPPQNSTFTPGSTMNLYVDFDGKSGRTNELDFEVQKYGTWYLATTSFRIEGGTPSTVNFIMKANASGVRVDDLKLTVAETASQTVEYGGPPTEGRPWAELPASLSANPDYKFIYHSTATVSSNQEVRNYSACYDIRRHNPVWVAYPCHPIYREGRGRTTPDPWQPDPEMSLSEQSIIFGQDYANWPYVEDLYQYWMQMPDGRNFTRGHLLRSDDRRGAGEEINIQTFYPTNIAPEELLYPDVHSELESLLTGSWTCSDTVYVVSGCYYGDDKWKTWDACSWDIKSDLSKECVVPTHIFKIYLRTKSGNTGRSVYDCSADELMAIGFWLPQDVNGEGERSGGNVADFAYSVDEIEGLTGNEFEFFPEVPDEVTAAYDLNDWGL